MSGRKWEAGTVVFRCSICRSVSWHPADAEHGWCAACNMYPPGSGAYDVVALSVARQVTSETLGLESWAFYREPKMMRAADAGDRLRAAAKA